MLLKTHAKLLLFAKTKKEVCSIPPCQYFLPELDLISNTSVISFRQKQSIFFFLLTFFS